MANHPHRDRLNLAPLSVNPHHGARLSAPKTCEPLAYIYGAHPLAPEGVLVKVKHSGHYAIWRGQYLEQVNQRKADAALQTMLENQ